MGENTIQKNVETVKEIILDEERLVTYASISKELCIHVNESKSLLYKVVENLQKKHPNVQLNVNFIISGLRDHNSASTVVCTEREMDAIRGEFGVVFFEHIYSVSKGLPSVDDVAFLAVNKFDDFPLCTGLIKSNVCIKRTADEIGSLKTLSQDSIVIERKPPVDKKEEKKNIFGINGEPSKVAKVQVTKSEPVIKTEKLSPKKDTTTEAKTKPEKQPVKNQKGIAGFFAKSNSAPSKKATNTAFQNKEIKQEEKAPAKDKKVKEMKSEKMDVDDEVDVESPKPETNKTKNKSISQIKKNAKVDKKRKRVLHLTDSESEDENNDPFIDEPAPIITQDESEDEIPPTPANNTVKITSAMVNPKKKRKIIDKTYTDDEGYILTKKVEVYESCSDSEEATKENVTQTNRTKPQISPKKEISPPDSKKNGPKIGRKKISPPQKGKQATMMNFFKKA